jgi:hypothetical protein
VCYISSMLRLCEQIPRCFESMGLLNLAGGMLLQKLREWKPRNDEAEPEVPYHCPMFTRIAGHYEMAERGHEPTICQQTIFNSDRAGR